MKKHATSLSLFQRDPWRRPRVGRSQGPSSCSAGIDLLVPAVQLEQHGAQGRVKAGLRASPRHGLDASRPRLDRPSTVLPSPAAVSITGVAAPRFSSRTPPRQVSTTLNSDAVASPYRFAAGVPTRLSGRPRDLLADEPIDLLPPRLRRCVARPSCPRVGRGGSGSIASKVIVSSVARSAAWRRILVRVQ